MVIPRTLAAHLSTRQADLSSLLRKGFDESSAAGGAPLTAGRRDEIATEEACSFLRFLEKPDDDAVLDRGRSLAAEGLEQNELLTLVGLYRDFCICSVPTTPGSSLGACLAMADRYLRLLLAGYMREREKLVETGDDRFRQALAASLGATLLADPDGIVRWANPAFLSLWGCASVAEAAGLSMGDFWTGEEARGVLEMLPITGAWRGELTARRRDGGVVSVATAIAFLRDPEARPVGIVASCIDVSEQKQLQAQVLQSQKMNTMGQLAAGIAHDFNNLLTAVGGYLQLLLLDAPSDTQMHQDLMQIKTAVDRGIGLTRQLRMFTRQTASTRQVMVLNDVAMETWEILRHTFPPEIAIELGLSPALWRIEADANQVSQIIVNLCVNARDAMMDRADVPPGGTLSIETANVEITPSEASRFRDGAPGRYVCLSVRDTGIGMPRELMDRLFVPFVTTKTSRKGTGLGLAVVYGIVVDHGGFIDVRSEPGRGSAFQVYLPRSDSPACIIAPEPQAPPAMRGHGTVLLVDDEPQVREVMCRTLMSCGYDVLEVADGKEALSTILLRKGIALVILDLIMPGMGGRECLTRIRALDPGLPVLIATGDTSGTPHQRLLDMGANGVIEKPLDLGIFLRSVQDVLSRTDPRGQR